MNCPQCDDVLVTLELMDIEVDYCTTCGGIWLDKGELEYLINISGGIHESINMDLPADTNEKPRQCPLCRKRMKKIQVQENGSLIIDRCERHGLWLDDGELHKILDTAGLKNNEHPLAQLLDEMFAARNKGGNE